ncbi:hypothetical protein LTR10_010135 [Elasticomyces elasticus]|nr:hypothetical protein LTR10_010135 [Elasticomyces elasticus]KAK4972040.1 hypothetical protein LTR42_006545 [Elasticomyces elasticus]
MSKTLKAGLAWALPVKPDNLLVTIDAYTTALPTIRALRKCNRYGQGPQAYVTKLPAEIVSAIESILFDKQLRQYNRQHYDLGGGVFVLRVDLCTIGPFQRFWA